ncbi:GspH/FimT family pseudopilin [Actimicrobium sp. CCC2.4]|uniref:GspH/FimT family pseudopilin n=1 Tax=Actimicrobium sp. CCC2.4 TaxID=3048606 RepID=UPI002AC8E448|nr:GspH/FimT family pseudopilin [Actimicrobium sp. CCC2.4]MEB0135686.1 GspH/FimT family pseudopilin [Actimicrobium sp. CCC2.4]WPX33755.1 GspH/FimT family pseudopilin [Actimicrobium sp. CCC2.4]
MTTAPSPVPSPSAAFTLVELLVAMAIVAILLGLAAPSFQSFVLDARITSEAQKILLALQTARSEASRINASVLLCTSAGDSVCGTDWKTNKLVFADTDNNKVRGTAETLVFSGAPAAATTTITGPSSGWIQFHPSGQANAAATFKLCDTRPGNVGRLVSVGLTGRPSLTTTTCP